MNDAEQKRWPNGDPVLPASPDQLQAILECAPYVAVIELMMEQLWTRMPVCQQRWEYLIMRETFEGWRASLGRYGGNARCSKEDARVIMEAINSLCPAPAGAKEETR